MKNFWITAMLLFFIFAFSDMVLTAAADEAGGDDNVVGQGPGTEREIEFVRDAVFDLARELTQSYRELHEEPIDFVRNLAAPLRLDGRSLPLPAKSHGLGGPLLCAACKPQVQRLPRRRSFSN